MVRNHAANEKVDLSIVGIELTVADHPSSNDTGCLIIDDCFVSGLDNHDWVVINVILASLVANADDGCS